MTNNDKIRLKEPKTLNEQIHILRGRNLNIEDEVFAKKVLSQINYYRFSAYTLTLKKGDTFNDNVSFEDVYRLYEFDRKLRLLLLSQLEIIEVSFRTGIAYHLAHKYGALGYLEVDNYINENYFDDMKFQLGKEFGRSKEIFVSHHKDKYEGAFPIWVAIEVTSFSLLSKIYSNIKNTDQSIIARSYSNNKEYIKNWIHVLSTVRNICAHHGRLYNRHLPIHFKLSKEDRASGIKVRTIFGAIYVMGKLSQDEQIWKLFINNLSALIEEYNTVDLQKIGFPIDWEKKLLEI